jgi:uncharacterized protein
MRARWMTRALRAALVSALLAGSVLGSGCAYLDWKQREWIFRPVKNDWNGYRNWVAPNLEEMWLPVDAAGTEKLHTWWWPAEGPNAASAPSILYLHGTRWNLTGNAFRIARLHKMGFNVLAVDYRGFGQSSGELPSEQWTYEDAAIAWAYLKMREPNMAKRYIYGHSLGGAIAIDLVSKTNDAAGLIVESTFTSIRDMVPTWARILPVGLILTQEFDSTTKIADVRIPILFVHGKQDSYVPAWMTEQLHDAARAPKRLWLVEGASHSNTMWRSFDAYSQTMLDFRGFALAQRAK